MKKLLLIGPEVTDFLNPLATKLKNIGYTVDLLETRKIPRNNINISNSYSEVLNFNEIIEKRISIFKIIKYLFTLSFYQNLFTTFFFSCHEDKCKIVKSLRNSLAAQYSKELFAPIFNKYDIINFHSLSPGTLSYIKPINRDKKIILSFWGSDLYQVWGLRNYFEQFEAIQRADAVTVMSNEMELMVLAKFGSGMKNKIVHTLFGLSDAILDRIDEAKTSSKDLNFIRKYSIPENKVKITIGYCANSICNHLNILLALEKIDYLTRENIHLLVPMTYGNYSNEYMDSVRNSLNKTKISYTLFDTFLSLDELVKLRINSDIMIQMSKSDALSASICEYLYAGNILISAIWLPYSRFRLEGVFFYETDFSLLNEKVTFTVNNLQEIKLKLLQNPARIKKIFDSGKTLEQWTELINSLS